MASEKAFLTEAAFIDFLRQAESSQISASFMEDPNTIGPAINDLLLLERQEVLLETLNSLNIPSLLPTILSGIANSAEKLLRLNFSQTIDYIRQATRFLEMARCHETSYELLPVDSLERITNYIETVMRHLSDPVI